MILTSKTKGIINMTNKEYIEKNNISFSEAMKMYDNQKYPCINDWLNQEHNPWKFKIGDVIAFKDSDEFKNEYRSFVNSHVYFVVDSDSNYLYIKKINRNGDIVYWNGMAEYNNKYKEDHSIKIIHKHQQDHFKKIA